MSDALRAIPFARAALEAARTKVQRDAERRRRIRAAAERRDFNEVVRILDEWERKAAEARP